jgi:hypothetical protein
MRLLVTLACLGVSFSIGFVYARDIYVNGWQLWSWLACCIVLAAVFLLGSGRPSLPMSRQLWLWPLLLFGIALLLRITFLETIPGGLHVDEVGIADFSLRHIYAIPHETLNPFRTGPASQPSLYHYVLRLSMAVGGASIFGLRLSSALAGALAVLVTYGMVAVFHNRRAALFSAAIMTTYHYHVHWSRIGLNNIWDTLWVPLMLAPFVWGWRKGWSGGAVLSGIAVGLSQYFYAGSRVGVILLALLILHLYRESRRSDKDNPAPPQEPTELQTTNQPNQPAVSFTANYPITQLPITNHQLPLLTYTLKMVLTAACVTAPLVLYALRDPVPFFERSQTVWGWRPETIWMVMGSSSDVLGYTWRQLWRSVGAFTAVPDVTGFYGPGVPLLIGAASPLFVIGLLWAIVKNRFLPVAWIILTVILGGFLLSDPPGSSHYVVAIPAICWLVAVPLEWLASMGRERLAVGVLAAVIAVDLYFYFVIYIHSNPRDLIHVFPTL